MTAIDVMHGIMNKQKYLIFKFIIFFLFFKHTVLSCFREFKCDKKIVD